ncbi:MAG TPA: PA14 domain-containing protein [Candidatus Polarisedimenticolia bacterium]|nr:PA14 domain-containing protein [Candidatus Polarisedimenticolia bacterium]
MSSTRRLAWAAGAVASAWLLLVGSLLQGRGGLEGTYSFVGAGGQEVEVSRRLDPRLDFPVPQRLDAAYIFHWDYQKFGFPSAMPPYVVRWRGLLSVPETGTYGFSVDAQGAASLSIDGASIEIRPDATTDRPLSQGLHPIAVEYRLDSGDARFVLSWQPPGRRQQPIPQDFLAPDRGHASASGGKTIGWGLLAAGVVAAVALWRRGGRSRDGFAGRLLQGLQEERPRLALGAIVLLAAVLRFHDYALVPFHHETADEYQHAWEGWHLLHTLQPAAWTTFPDAYPPDQAHDFRWFGDRYIVVRPYFDHPPLFSIPVGIVCSFAGARSFLECTLPAMRLVPILLSLAGLLLLDRLARAYGCSERATLLAALVYAVVPVVILGQRLVKAESLLALLFMGALLAVRPNRPGGPARGAVTAGILGALSLWTKATGLGVVAVTAIALLAQRRRRDALVATGIAGAGLLLYLGYAAAYDFGIFLEVMQGQASSKWVSAESFRDLLGGKAVVKWFGGGTYLWLWIALAVAALRRGRMTILVPVAVYATLLALSADHRVVYGWYRVPLYPFLCIAAGVYLDEMLQESDLPRTFLFAMTAVVSALLYALPEAVGQSRPVLYLFAAAALLPFLPRIVTERPWAHRLAAGGAIVLLLLFVVANVATVGGLLEIYSRTRGTQ